MKSRLLIARRILSSEISLPHISRRRFARRKRVRKIAAAYLWTAIILGSLMFAGLAASLLLDYARPSNSNDGQLYIVMIGSIWVVGIGAVIALLLRQSILEDAIRIQNKEAVGFAVNMASEALLPPYRSTEEVINNSRMAQRTLLHLLPQLQSNDANLLTARQYDKLCRLLTSYITPPELVVAILKALEQIGDSAAIPYVENLITRELTIGDNKAVLQAAQKCLPFLIERAKREGFADTLLRASQPHISADALLRPATAAGNGNKNAQELLRVGMATHEETRL